ncbi:unnamed protein product [Adineta steineri]|uniref:Uncharacterized protein n=1 Tax=Adineta steineri TaxID=433720 RepID=A0A814TN62_9BILA|nr:unnamed protein product [Adineta steineri]CAF4036156.1 unnamed protein product [Adineta steineri]
MSRAMQQYLFLTLMFLSSSSSEFSTFDAKYQFAEQQNATVWAGGIIAGTVEYAHGKHPEWNITNVSVELFGKVSYYDFFTKTSRRTYDFLNERLMLRSASDSKDLLPEFRNYSWPFSFRLNKSLPPTIEKMSYTSTYVVYYINFVFERPGWYNKNIEKRFNVNIQHSMPLTNAKKVEQQKTNRNGAHLHVILHKNIVVVGKTFSFEINLHNPKKASVYRISAALLQIVSGGGFAKKTATLHEQNLDRYGLFRAEKLQQQFKLHVPLKAASTWVANYTYGFPKNKPFIVRHNLQIKAYIRGFLTNIRLQLPLTIIYTNETQTD